jgi:hypothetical protein
MLTRTAALTLLGSVCAINACSGAPPPPPATVSAPAPAAPAASAATTAAPFTFVPIAGAWTPTIDDGQPTMTADGTKPSSGSPHPLIGQLFGADAETFVKRTTGPEAFPLVVVREMPAFKSGRLAMQFKLIGGKSDQLAGLVFNLKPDGTYNFARYNTKDGNVAIWQVVNGKREVVAHGEVHRQLALGQWHDLVVNIDGANVTAAADNGAMTVAHALPAPVDGRIGLWTKADSVTAFRGLTATAK